MHDDQLGARVKQTANIRERSMCFTAPDVRALLAETKTQTRPIVKPQPITGLTKSDATDDGRPYWIDRTKPQPMPPLTCGDQYVMPSTPLRVFCPYGQPGDRLWVRETWKFLGTDMNRHGRTHSVQDGVVTYPADGSKRTITTDWQNVEVWMTRKSAVRPSIHMPRWVSRISLQITDVRVQRLQDISEEDAEAEGASPEAVGKPDGSFAGVSCIPDYRAIWNEIRGAGSWDANPWVWAISFKRVAA